VQRDDALSRISKTGSFWWALVFSLLCLCLARVHAQALTVFSSESGKTPSRLGYNLGHFMPASNAADWFRYAGVDAARIFISVSDIEPSDDIFPVGDGVNSEATFFARRNLLRANSASNSIALGTTYVKWSTFSNNYSDTTTSGNRTQFSYALGNLRDQGISILVNLTASPSRFPISDANDWAGRWELWQHYYAEAFLLSRDYGVRNFSMFNEPNGWTGMTEPDWLVRYLFCSDAIQSAVADMNARYGKSLIPCIFAPNTANGAEKYNSSTDTWGRTAVINRHLGIDGSSSTTWRNLHIYNYQKYTTRTNATSSFSGYIEDYDSLRGSIDADTVGEPSLPMALTEFNVRTGANYDTVTETQDSPSDYAALGANLVALSGRGVDQIYLFKFGQTTSSGTTYGVAKNGTHYVENSSSGDNNYGGATQCAEVYRLFNKAATGGRSLLNLTASSELAPTATAGVWSMATRDAAASTYHLFIANKQSFAVAVEPNFAALALPEGNPVYVEEVSGRSNGGIVRVGQLENGRLSRTSMPAQSVWLITVPTPALHTITKPALADTELGDGSWKMQAGGSTTSLRVRADGTIDGRRVALIKLPIPGEKSPNVHSVLLRLNAATTAGTTPIQAHVYGVTDDSWQESVATWSNMTSCLRQNIASGNEIRRNVVASQGSNSLILGQVVVNSPVFAEQALDVTDFVKSRTGGFATFLVVQEHRWDIAQPALTVGDTQPEGLLIASRESSIGGPTLMVSTSDQPPFLVSQPQALSIQPGENAVFEVTATGTAPLAYQWRKNGVNIPGALGTSLTIKSVTEADAGEYDVVVSNRADRISSTPVSLTITGSGPEIISQPQPVIANVGETVTFSATAVGLGPLTYQWRKNDLNIPGAVMSAYTLANIASSDIGNYQVIVSNASGSVTSVSVLLSIKTSATVAREITVRGGVYAAVAQSIASYLMVKYNAGLDSSRKSYMQFDLPPGGVNASAPATFQISFTNNYTQAVQLWGLNGEYAGLSSASTWASAQANDTASNNLLTSGVNSATAIGSPLVITPGSGLSPYTFSIPRLGDFIFRDKVTFAISGVDHASNNASGLRILPAAANLKFELKAANTPPTISGIADQTIPENSPVPTLFFTVGDAETAANSLVVSAVSSDPMLVPQANIVIGGSGANRSLQLNPAAQRSGSAVITVTVSDGAAAASDTFLINVVRAPIRTWWFDKFGTSDIFSLSNSTTSDSDSDGGSNLLEYSQGGNPLIADRASWNPVLVREGDHFRFIYRKSASDLDYVIQESASLSNATWEPVVREETDHGDGTFSVTMPISGLTTFVRLKVSIR
jgi:hypothetical protein